MDRSAHGALLDAKLCFRAIYLLIAAFGAGHLWITFFPHSLAGHEHFLDLDSEFSFGSWFSAIQLCAVGIADGFEVAAEECSEMLGVTIMLRASLLLASAWRVSLSLRPEAPASSEHTELLSAERDLAVLEGGLPDRRRRQSTQSSANRR